MNDGIARLREAYSKGGLTGLASSLNNYLKWRFSSPEPSDAATLRLVEETDSAVTVVLMKDYYIKARLTERPLITVILPTRNRNQLLERSVGSVFDQVYENWELIVINDSPEPVSTASDDPRVRVMNNAGAGVAAARNQGLDTAKGDLITFLDDDNLMDPLWLKALALSAEQVRSADVFVGAQLVTPDPGHPEHHTIRFPTRFDWDELTRANYIDMGMLAHRPIQGVRFDEDLPALVDWDYVVHLTRNRSPVLVPALSGLYLTDSPGRISYSERQELVATMKERFAKLRLGNDVEAILGHHDVGALRTMLERLGRSAGRTPSISGATGSSLVESISGTLVAEGLARPLDNGQADVTFTDSLPDASTLTTVGESGYLVGLTAHLVDYSPIGLPHSRRIGDHLWLGRHKPFNAEELFDGATLVKFGVKGPT